jgi:hypothetical protein
MKTEIVWSLKNILILILMCNLVVHFECNKVNVHLPRKMHLTLRIEFTPSTTHDNFEQCYTCTLLLHFSAFIGRSWGNLLTEPGKVTEKHAYMFCSYYH